MPALKFLQRYGNGIGLCPKRAEQSPAGVLGHPARLLALRDPRRSAFRTPPGRRCGFGQTGVPGPVTAAGSDPVRRVAAAAIRPGRAWRARLRHPR
jgi:hypothetical protein